MLNRCVLYHLLLFVLIGVCLGQPLVPNNEDQCFINKLSIISEHNLLREKHGSGELLWNDKLAIDAQLMADKISKENNCVIMEGVAPPGTNYLSANSLFLSDEDVVRRWYSGSSQYDFQLAAPFSGGVSNPLAFTQMIWSDSKYVGCGRACCENTNDIWVCQYLPVGNVPGTFANNVQPLKKVFDFTNTKQNATSHTRKHKKGRKL